MAGLKNRVLWELPLGITVCGNLMKNMPEVWQMDTNSGEHLPGGASTDFLIEEHLDVKMDFSTVAAAGSRLGNRNNDHS